MIAMITVLEDHLTVSRLFHVQTQEISFSLELLLMKESINFINRGRVDIFGCDNDTVQALEMVHSIRNQEVILHEFIPRLMEFFYEFLTRYEFEKVVEHFFTHLGEFLQLVSGIFITEFDEEIQVFKEEL